MSADSTRARRVRHLLRLIAAVLLVAGACSACIADPARSDPAATTSPVTRHPAAVPTASGTRIRPAAVIPHPVAGAVLRHVLIPAANGFRPRPAYIYLPPAAVRHPDRRLPVLEMLHGDPGGPSDWLTGGKLVSTMDAFAAAHGGQAPVVVMPDSNGSQRADSECIRTAQGIDVESYLTGDVVRWMRAHYRGLVGTERWWVAGLSEGGVCSVMLALRHPTLYSAYGDFSGLAAPIVDHVTPAQSDLQLYGGDTRAKLEHSPLWLLSHRRYHSLPGWFECGAQDRKTLAAQDAVVRAARAAHLVAVASTVPGTHRWTVWSAALRSMLPWIWRLR